MKYFIVNVNNCLSTSQYAPFFYEHIYKGDLVMLEDIEDTCQLEKTYWEIQSHINRKPFPKRQCVILLLIPRDFALPLRPQDYELYNDINTYMHLLRLLDDDFMVYTIYVDRTGELEQNDAIYQKLKTVNASLQAKYPELTSHFLSIDKAPQGTDTDYKKYLEQQISQLCECMRPFYLYMLKNAPEMQGDATQFQNGLNNYIGEARRILNEVKRIYAPFYRGRLAGEIEEWLKLIHYLKAMIRERKKPEQLPDYESYVFGQEEQEHTKRLLATYRARLSNWNCSPPAISKQGTASRWEFCSPSHAAEAYGTRIDEIIKRVVKEAGAGKSKGGDAVDAVFAELKEIVANAWSGLLELTGEQSKILLDPKSYQKVSDETFDLDDSGKDDENTEAKKLKELNEHSSGVQDIPDFSAENRLEQELEQINHQLDQIIENLKVYSKRSFAVVVFFALLAIAGLYAGAQYSIFIKENTWWIFGAYLLVSGAVFGVAYWTVRKQFEKEIAFLLRECVKKVTNFLEAFKGIAEDFEKNIQASGQYNCLKRQLDEKAAARKQYQEAMRRYAWHKMKVKQLLQNMIFFESFIGDAAPYEEGTVSLESFDNDAEHTEFYQIKVFRR